MIVIWMRGYMMKSNLYDRGFKVPIIIRHERSLTHNNMAELSGQVVSDVEENHECYDLKYYKFYVQSFGKVNYTLPVIISHYLRYRSEAISGLALKKGVYVSITNGAWRSYNEVEQNRTRLAQSLFVKKMLMTMTNENINPTNKVILDGYICRGGHPNNPHSVYVRKTPQSGRRIVDVLIAVNRPRGSVNRKGFTPTKTDYLPLLFWDELSDEAAKLRIGDRVQVEALMQSRNYEKINGFDEISLPIYKQFVAYELSAVQFKVIDEQLM